MKKIVVSIVFLFLFPVLILLGGCSSPNSHIGLSGQFYVAKDKAGYYVKVNGEETEYAVTKHMPLENATAIAELLNADIGSNWYYLENP
jgi:uncharacterized protein YceK